MVHVSEYEEYKEEILLDLTQANRHGELYCWWHLVLYCAAVKQISSILSKAENNNKKHSNHHLRHFQILSVHSLEVLWERCIDYWYHFIDEESVTGRGKALLYVSHKASGKSRRTTFFVWVCIQEINHLSHFFLHMKELKLPKKV